MEYVHKSSNMSTKEIHEFKYHSKRKVTLQKIPPNENALPPPSSRSVNHPINHSTSKRSEPKPKEVGGPVNERASRLSQELNKLMPLPSKEEFVCKRKNVSNSLISSDSIHHSIYLESGREKRQCLLQYLSKIASEGQVVIYTISIPGVESLLAFLTKHGFNAIAVHPRMLMAESNWILSQFSLKRFKILLIAEDHYHSCPAHFRWVKTIINYDLPVCNPVENWATRNGIVDFSDDLPVHIYTFIKKKCGVDTELVKILQLDSGDHDQENLSDK